MTPVAATLSLFLLVFGFAGAALAAEEIRDFHAVIDLRADGTLSVTETISVNVEGRQISRGIFRDIPVRYEDRDGRTREVQLDVRAVKRDGQNETYVTERNSGVLRIRIGNADILLPHRVHSYEITYDTTRQIRYFDDHDELYWNVTGNGWDFPILKSSVEVRLPPGARAGDVAYFTGPFGSTERAARAERADEGNRIIIQATRVLGRREGLTIVVAVPKGVVVPPSAADRQADWLADNLGWIVGGVGLATVLGFYLWAWRRVGRDPPKDIIVPRWTPPEGVSPALANYIEKRGFKGAGWDAFSASIIDLAVKGHLVLEQPSNDMTIRRRGNGNPGRIGVGQRAILNLLPQDGDTLTVDKSSGETIQAVGRAFRMAMEREHRNQFYRGNVIYLAAGMFVSAAVILFVIAAGGFAPEIVAVAFGMIVPSVIIAVLAVNVGRRYRTARSLGARIWAVTITAFTGFVTINVAAAFFALLTQIEFDPRVVATVAGLMVTNIVFFLIIGAPTPLGQKRSAEVAGLKQYLTLAERDRMNMNGAPEMSPQHFETLLPYAVALGVEKPWTRTFDTWLAGALAAGTATYAGPDWFQGGDFSPDRIGSRLEGMAGSLADSFTASLPAPKSSSSGFSSGGGFSGGGGGGGGGGGW